MGIKMYSVLLKAKNAKLKQEQMWKFARCIDSRKKLNFRRQNVCNFFEKHKNSIFVQAAVEANVVEGGGGGADKGNLNLGLVLQEVRRRADSDTLARHTQDIFKAVHNVQKRLLEEHVSSTSKMEFTMTSGSCHRLSSVRPSV
jgi:hypothetical protein